MKPLMSKKEISQFKAMLGLVEDTWTPREEHEYNMSLYYGG